MASTYVNDLRLNEMATGDASGSWGTVTNTNLELIGEAFGYGTETIGNADTTITVADGAADPARSFYLKIASSADLTTTRTVTLAPNTVSKVWVIENATTGSQIITIKQGTGATINIPNGHVKMIASNGGGSGAIIYDLLTDLNVATNLFVKNAGTGDGSTANIYLQTAEADIAADDVIGKINFQAPNEGTGTDAILVSAAIQAISEGDFSSSSNATSLNFMTGASEAAATKMTLTSGGDLKLVTDSAVLGFGADNDTTLTHTDGSGLTLNSTNKIMFNDTSQFIQGSSATVLSIAATDEIDLTATAIDLNGTLDVSGTALVTGILTTTAQTVFNGGFTSADSGTMQGSSLIYFRDAQIFIRSAADGDLNIAADDEIDLTSTLIDINGNLDVSGTIASASPITITSNTPYLSFIESDQSNKEYYIGSFGASFAVYDASNSVYRFVIASDGSLSTPTLGTSNVRFGVNAGNSIASGAQYNVFVGDEAGTAISTGDRNTAVGFGALATEDAHGYTVAVGYAALNQQNAGAESYNTAVGYAAGNNVTTGTLNTIVGASAGAGNTFVASAVTLLGYNAGNAVTTSGADGLTAIGKDACELVTSVNATAVGSNALSTLVSGAGNTAVGQDSLALVTSGNNTAVGKESASNLSSGADITAVGSQAGKFATTADSCTFIGRSAGRGITDAKLTGNYNTAIGQGAGLLFQGAAANNTGVGASALQSLTTGSGNVAIGQASGGQGAMIDITTEDNRAVFGHSSITNSYVEVDWTVTSDARDKMNFAEVPHGLSFVNDLQPIKFDFKKSRDDATPHGRTKYGFKAQDILALEGDNPIIIDNEFEDSLKITNSHLMPVLVKAVQELSTALDAALARIATLEG